MLDKIDLQQLAGLGWTVLHLGSPGQEALAADVLRLARGLGELRPIRGRGLLDVLVPTKTEEARPRSMSAMVGRGRQPWHVDAAHWPRPARFILLACAQSSNDEASTELLHAEELIAPSMRTDATSEPFLIRNGPRSFYGTVLGKAQPFVRFDPGCMQGTTRRAARLMQMLLTRDVEPSYSHRWYEGDVLVIDNWKTLHRRADASRSSRRVLLRVSVKDAA